MGIFDYMQPVLAAGGGGGNIPLAMVSVGLLVFAAHLFNAIFQRFRMPDTIWLIAIGILIGPVFHFLEPSDFGVVGGIFTTIALVVILFEAGLDLSFKHLRDSLASTMRITLSCYFLTTVIITLTVHYWGGYEWITSLFVGAVLAGPSPPVIIPMAKSLNLREHNRVLLTLESAVGEAICLVIALAILRLYRVSPGADGSGGSGEGSSAVDLANTTGQIGEIISAFIIAVIIGIVGGILWALMLEKVRQLKNSISTTLSFVFIVYGICEMLHYSGPVAALMFGITIGNIQLLRNLPMFSEEGPWTPTNHSATEVMFFSEIVFLLKTFFFVYLGLSMALTDLSSPVAFGIVGMLLLARLVAVKGTLNKEIHIAKEGLFLGVMIPKGLAAAVLASLAAQPTSGMPRGDDAENLIYAVILYSILASAILVFLIDKAHIHLGFVWLFPTRDEEEAKEAEGKKEPGENLENGESRPVATSGEEDEDTSPHQEKQEKSPGQEAETPKENGEKKAEAKNVPAGNNHENEKKIRQSIEEGLKAAKSGKPEEKAPATKAAAKTPNLSPEEEHEIHAHPDRSLADLTIAGEEEQPKRRPPSHQKDFPELGTGGGESEAGSSEKH